MPPTFFVQATFSTIILLFSLWGFASPATDVGDKAIYASWVGLVVGYWLPTPITKNFRVRGKTSTSKDGEGTGERQGSVEITEHKD